MRRFCLAFIVLLSCCVAVKSQTDEASDNLMENGGTTNGNLTYTLETADSAYVNRDYVTAAAIYEHFIENVGVSETVYMNLGNSYFHMDNLAKAILYYERAHLLNPTDEDIKFNIELANTKIVDRETSTGGFSFKLIVNRFSSMMNIGQWTVLVLVMFMLFVVSMSVWLFSRKEKLGKVLLPFSALFLLLSALSYGCAYNQKSLLTDRTSAIIMSANVNVKSTPTDNGTDLFVLHEGKKVNVVDSSMKDWVEIRLNDGNQGWIPVTSLEII